MAAERRFGRSPLLEYEFSVRNKTRLKAGWLVTCGGGYNFVAGISQRAPLWMQAMGLEWLFRLMLEPRRLFRRYAATNPLAFFLLFDAHTLNPGGVIAMTVSHIAERAAPGWRPGRAIVAFAGDYRPECYNQTAVVNGPITSHR